MTNNIIRSGRVPRLAIVGCGAFTELYYLPALVKHPEVLARLILVDRDGARAQKLAAEYHVSRVEQDYHTILTEVDGVIIATPHRLHYPISMDFIQKSVHILCEKPLAESPDEAREMVAAASSCGVSLATNYTQRLFPSSGKVKELIAAGALGKLTKINYTWGSFYTWPTASGFYFNAKESPKGVLLDRGPHPLDLICWWLGAKPTVVSFKHDSFGGPEAVAEIHLRHNDCDIEIKLSWLNELSNTYTITGEAAEITNGIEEWWHIPLTYRSGKRETIKLEQQEEDYMEFGQKIVGNFLDVMSKGAKPLIPAHEVVSSVELIAECYQAGERFSLPWYENVDKLVPLPFKQGI